MSQERLNQLFEFLQEEPDNPFLLYAIALEYEKNNLTQARMYYEKLLQEHPDYLATYYHAARLYVSLDEKDKAVQTFEKGIEKANSQQAALALRELKNAYQEFLFEEE